MSDQGSFLAKVRCPVLLVSGTWLPAFKRASETFFQLSGLGEVKLAMDNPEITWHYAGHPSRKKLDWVMTNFSLCLSLD
jgi:hypothetical protein